MNDENEEVTYSLVLPFDSDDPEFARGMTCGMLWEALKNDPHRYRVQVTADCAEMVLRISEATGRAVMTLSDVDNWLDVEFAAAY
jgi:hypothetical protein